MRYSSKSVRNITKSSSAANESSRHISIVKELAVLGVKVIVLRRHDNCFLVLEEDVEKLRRFAATLPSVEKPFSVVEESGKDSRRFHWKRTAAKEARILFRFIFRYERSTVHWDERIYSDEDNRSQNEKEKR